MTYVLPGALVPHDEESLAGLVMRNASRFGFRDPTRLFARLPVSPRGQLNSWLRNVARSGQDGGIARLLGLEDDVFRRASPWHPDNSMVNLLLHPVRRSFMAMEERRACPACLRASAHHVAAWQVAILPVCGRHGTSLVRRCPRCDGGLWFSGMGVAYCSVPTCGYDIRDVAGEQANWDVRAVRGLVGMLDMTTDPRRLPSGLPFDEALQLTLLLGGAALGPRRPSVKPTNAMRRGEDGVREIVASGWSALDGWPDGFQALLLTLQERAVACGANGSIGRTFPVLSSKLIAWRGTTWGDAMGREFVRFLAGRRDVVLDARTFAMYGDVSSLERSVVPVKEASSRLGVTDIHLARIMKHRGLALVGRSGRSKGGGLLHSCLRTMEDEVARHGTLTEVREVLGIDALRFPLVEHSGLLFVLPERDRVNHLRRFRWDEVHALLAAWRGDARELQAGEQPGEDLVSLLDDAVVVPRRLIDSLTAARDGILQAAVLVPGEAGLRGVRFRREDVERALGKVLTWMGIQQVARRLGISEGAVALWTRRGFLRPPRWNHSFPKFTEAALQAFQAEFFVGGTDPRDPAAPRFRYLTRHIKAIGVAPVSGRGVDGCKLSLFRRADFTPDVLSRLTARVESQERQRPCRAVRIVHARERIASLVTELWGTRLVACWHATLQAADGRLLLVVPARHLSASSNWRFMTDCSALEKVEGAADGWLALLSPLRDEFMLVRCGDVRFGPARPNNPKRLLVLPQRDNLPELLRDSLVALGEPQRHLSRSSRIAGP